MSKAVVGRVLIGRHAADNVTTHFHGLFHQLVTAWILNDPLLREGNKLQGHLIFILFTKGQHPLERFQAADGIDIHVGADRKRPVHERLIKHRSRAKDDIFVGVLFLPVPDNFDRLGQGAAHILADTVEDVHFIQVDMGINKRGNNQFSFHVDHFVSLKVEPLADRMNRLALAVDVP